MVASQVRTVALLFSALSQGAPESDDKGDRSALTALAVATGSAKWTKATHWLDDGVSICDWKGVSCTSGRVTKLSLPDNALDGTLPADLSKLTELETLKLSSTRPDDYHGCGSNNLRNSSLEPLLGLKKLTSLNLEYTCLGGTLEGLDGMTSLESLQIHGNYISGTIPAAMGRLEQLQVMKLGRNPISGTVPAFTTLRKLKTFNCNFCAVSGQFPDIFGSMPLLEQSFWDGNGLTGTLPPSLGLAPSLAKVSFNINSLTGPIPEGLCDIPAGESGDCRIGADTDVVVYQAEYLWLLPVSGNLFDCSAGAPKCTRPGSRCNQTKANNPPSPVLCKDASGSIQQVVV